MATYVITGGNGFIGEHLVKLIEAAGDVAIIASRSRSRRFSTDTWIDYDLKDNGTVANILRTVPDGVFHLAWSTTPTSADADPYADVAVNVAGTVYLMNQLALHSKAKVVFASSGGTVYGEQPAVPISESQSLNPTSIYGISKAGVESYLTKFSQDNGLDARIARIANPFGKSQPAAKQQGAASIFARLIGAGQPLTIWGDGNVIRDYIAVSDVATALYAVMKLSRGTEQSSCIVNVGSGEGLSLLQLIAILERELGRVADISFQPSRRYDLPYNVLDVRKIQELTGWAPSESVRFSIEEMARDIRRR